MKTTQLIILAALCFIFKANAQQNTYHINGQIGKTDQRTKVFLLKYTSPYEFPYVMLDSAEIINGEFNFTGQITAPARACLVSLPYDGKGGKDIFLPLEKHLNFYLEPGKTFVKSKDSLFASNVTGSVSTTEYIEYQERMRLLDEARELISEREYEDGKMLSLNKAEASKRSSKIIKKNRALRNLRFSILKTFIQQYPHSAILLDMLTSEMTSLPQLDKIEPLYNAMSKQVKQSAKGKAFAALIQKLKTLTIGSVAPAFTLLDTAGKQVSLADFKGKYVLLDFWASWCGPCRAGHPLLVELYKKYNAKGFTILSVSLDIEKYKKAWIKAIKDDQLSWTQVADLTADNNWSNKAAKLYHVEGVPQNFLIDPDGKILFKDLRGIDLEDKMKELFEK